MRIGVRAHDFGKLPAEELAERIATTGFCCAQLALVKAIAGMDSDAGRLNPGLACSIGEAFRRYGVQIGVLGCYINLAHPDREERKFQLGRFKEHLRYARDFGCSVVATETGSLNADFSFHPGNRGEEAFSLVVESVAALVEQAERSGVFVGIEGVHSYVVSSPQRMKRLIDAINSEHLQVVFDPVNFLNEENYLQQDRIIQESFELFGDRMVAFHAKDFTIEQGRMEIVQVGKGVLNYELIVKLLKHHKPGINFLLEGVDLAAVEETLSFVKGLDNKNE